VIEVRTPTRLHFGFLAFGVEGEREFGGPGLMIRQPDVVMRLELTGGRGDVVGKGPLGDKAATAAARFLDAAMQRGMLSDRPGVAIDMRSVPRPHTGLGSGTQIAMAAGRGLCRLLSLAEPAVPELAAMVGRGRRSAIGVHGFDAGGFLLEGGKINRQGLSPLLMRRDFPENWRIIIIRPRALEGLAGEREHKAFGEMPAMPRQVTDELCRLVLLGMCPALVEGISIASAMRCMSCNSGWDSALSTHRGAFMRIRCWIGSSSTFAALGCAAWGRAVGVRRFTRSRRRSRPVNRWLRMCGRPSACSSAGKSL
jgi:beta-RFAP synthase